MSFAADLFAMLFMFSFALFAVIATGTMAVLMVRSLVGYFRMVPS